MPTKVPWNPTAPELQPTARSMTSFGQLAHRPCEALQKMRYLFHDCFMILTRCSGCDFKPVVCLQTPGFASSRTKHGPIFVYQVRIPFSTCLIRWTIKLMGPKHKPKKKSDVERSCAHVYVLNPTEILYSEVLLKKMSRYGKINLHILLENKSSNDDISQGGNQSM